MVSRQMATVCGLAFTETQFALIWRHRGWYSGPVNFGRLLMGMKGLPVLIRE